MDEMNQYPIPEQPKGGKGLAIAAMVIGIVSIVFSCCIGYISLVGGIVGLVLGIVSLKQNRDGHGMAIAGVIMCAISLVLGICSIIFAGVLSASLPYLEDYLSSLS